VAVSRAHRAVACGGNDQCITVVDIDSGKREARLATAGDVLSLAVVGSQPLLVSGDSSGTVSVWGLRTAGRSYTLVAAFRNQPLAFSALYQPARVAHGAVARAGHFTAALGNWVGLATARSNAASARSAAGGEDAGAVGIASTGRSSDSDDSSVDWSAPVVPVRTAALPPTSPLRPPSGAAKPAAAVAVPPAAARSGSLRSTSTTSARLALPPLSSPAPTPGRRAAPTSPLLSPPAGVPTSMSSGWHGGVAIPSLQLGLGGPAHPLAAPPSQPFPKPCAVLRLAYNEADATLVVGDDAGTVSSWDFSTLVTCAAASAAAAAAAGAGATASTPGGPATGVRLARVPSFAGSVAEAVALPAGTRRVVDIGFPNAAVSVQSAVALLEARGAAPGTFPVAAMVPSKALDSRSAETTRRSSALYHTGLTDPALAVLPLLKPPIGGGALRGGGGGGSSGATAAAAGGGMMASELPGPELVAFKWSTQLHDDVVACVSLIAPEEGLANGRVGERDTSAIVLTAGYDKLVKAVHGDSGRLLGMLTHATVPRSGVAPVPVPSGRLPRECVAETGGGWPVPAVPRPVATKRGRFWELPFNVLRLQDAWMARLLALRDGVARVRALRDGDGSGVGVAGGTLPDALQRAQRGTSGGGGGGMDLMSTERSEATTTRAGLVAASASVLARASGASTPSGLMASMAAAEAALDVDATIPTNIMSDLHWVHREELVAPAAASRAARALAVVTNVTAALGLDGGGGGGGGGGGTVMGGSGGSVVSFGTAPGGLTTRGVMAQADSRFASAERLFHMSGGQRTGGTAASRLAGAGRAAASLSTPALLAASSGMRARLTKPTLLGPPGHTAAGGRSATPTRLDATARSGGEEADGVVVGDSRTLPRSMTSAQLAAMPFESLIGMDGAAGGGGGGSTGSSPMRRGPVAGRVASPLRRGGSAVSFVPSTPSGSVPPDGEPPAAAFSRGGALRASGSSASVLGTPVRAGARAVAPRYARPSSGTGLSGSMGIGMAATAARRRPAPPALFIAFPNNSDATL